MKKIEYYLMRHASYYDHDNQYVTYQGMLNLKESLYGFLNDFNKKFLGKDIRIIHSTLPRVKHTALLIEEMLFSIKTFKRNDPRLNSDHFEINRNYINEVVSDCDKEGKICLILSHQPDIEAFCQKKLQNSEFIKMSIEIEEKTTQKNEGSDDLPF